MNAHDTMILSLADCPQHDRPQIDLEICEDMRRMVAKGTTAKRLKEILDKCVHGARCSDFAIKAMDMVWQQLLEEEKNNDTE